MTHLKLCASSKSPDSIACQSALVLLCRSQIVSYSVRGNGCVKWGGRAECTEWELVEFSSRVSWLTASWMAFSQTLSSVSCRSTCPLSQHFVILTGSLVAQLGRPEASEGITTHNMQKCGQVKNLHTMQSASNKMGRKNGNGKKEKKRRKHIVKFAASGIDIAIDNVSTGCP